MKTLTIAVSRLHFIQCGLFLDQKFKDALYLNFDIRFSKFEMRVLFLLPLLVPLVLSDGEDDLVNLPGVTFQTNFKTYSGYLNAGNNGTWRMHYVLHESQSNPATDPLLLWFNGGPGCSSFGGLFEELGPFYVNMDGQTLFENVYAWNKKANVLALESPTGVGFSYDSSKPMDVTAGDDRSRDQNYNALKDFFNKVQPRYNGSTFFLSGESYAGIYIPMLSARIVQGINEGDFPNPNFQGAAIGNGFMHVQKLMNALVLWSAYHGRISQSDWNTVKANCRTPGANHSDDYNYQQYMTTNNGMDYYGDNSPCGKLINPLITDYPAGNDISFDQYNFYQDCYVIQSGKTATGRKARKVVTSNAAFGEYVNLGSNTAKLTNYDSTDTQWGYPCWNDIGVYKYLNRKDVQTALHIEAGWSANMPNMTWHDCNDPLYNNYNLTYPDMQKFFDYVIANVTTKGFRFLVYNGDVDTVCNYLGDEKFVDQLLAAHPNATRAPRNTWLFAQQLAGFYQRYDFKSLTIDVLTVKGAGHFVPNDRPGPSLQMITNLMWPFNTGTANYSSNAFVNSAPVFSPLIAQPAPQSAAAVSLLASTLAVICRFI